LTSEQRSRIDAIVARDGVSLAAVVREALDRYLDGAVPDAGTALHQTFGVHKRLEVQSRDQWSRG